MSRSEEMIGQLQLFQRKSKVYKALFDAAAAQFDNRDVVIADLWKQLSVETATWALDIYETELGIPVDRSKPYDKRRSVIKSKMRGTGKVDAALIKLVVDAFTNGEVEVSFDGRIIVQFTSVKGIPHNMEDVYVSIDEIKPAHLPVLYQFLYNVHDYLAQFTHDQLAAYTHEQLRTVTIGGV